MINKKRLFARKLAALLCALLLGALTLTGCGSGSPLNAEKTSPSELADELLAAMQSMDTEQLQTCFDGSIDLDLSPESILKIFAGNSADNGEDYSFISDFLRENASYIEGSVTASDLQANDGTVTMEFRYRDCTKIVDETVGEYFKTAMTSAMTGSEMSDDEILDLFTETLREKIGTAKTTSKTVTLDLPCVKTDEGWRLASDAETVHSLGDIMSGGVLSYIDKWTELMNITRHNEEIEETETP